MKRFFVTGFIVFLVMSSCVTMGIGSGTKLSESLSYNEVVEISGILSSELYTKINMWFVDTFNNAESVIQFQDKDSGVIKGKYTSSLSVGDGASIEYITAYSTITVEVKDEKYRISFTDANYRRTGNYFGGPNSYSTLQPTVTVDTEDVANVVLPDWKNIGTNLKQAISKENDDF